MEGEERNTWTDKLLRVVRTIVGVGSPEYTDAYTKYPLEEEDGDTIEAVRDA